MPSSARLGLACWPRFALISRWLRQTGFPQVGSSWLGPKTWASTFAHLGQPPPDPPSCCWAAGQTVPGGLCAGVPPRQEGLPVPPESNTATNALLVAPPQRHRWSGTEPHAHAHTRHPPLARPRLQPSSAHKQAWEPHRALGRFVPFPSPLPTRRPRRFRIARSPTPHICPPATTRIPASWPRPLRCCASP
jgi:hypothetical protein